ncbi:TonB family protein [Chelativorans sp.]|uniref:cell envelope integrity protein TolA n=1 Tax=Chelativorans sp. TaxID=2203393 RepID=UPI0028120B64|nr:TonB family protein [Chelativorans sp.]
MALDIRLSPVERTGSAVAGKGNGAVILDFVPAGERKNPEGTAAPLPANDERPPRGTELRSGSRPLSRKAVAIGLSLALHATAAIAILFAPKPPEVQIAGGEEGEIVLTGAALIDMSAAGSPSETIEPVEQVNPADVAALEPVETATESIAPVETTAVEPEEIPVLEPVETPPAPVAAVEPAEPVPVPAPTAAAVEPTNTETAEPVTVEEVLSATNTPPSNPVEPVPDTIEPVPEEEEVSMLPIPRPTPRPHYVPPKEAPRKAEKAPAPERKAERRAASQPEKKAEQPRQRRSSAGSGGRNEQDAKRGSAEGSRTTGNSASRGRGRAAEAGNAAVSNYPGKIVSKLRRSLRYPREAQRQRLKGEVRVAFTVTSSGAVSGIRVVGSSGSPVLDRAAVETVQRAAPFPPIPQGAGRSSWPFTVPLAFVR